MKQSFGLWQIWGFAVTALVGTLLHFLYEWLGNSLWIAPFSGVNESTWEHMKLLFWPTFLFAVTESFFFSGREELWRVKLRGILLGICLIPVIFYTYNGVIGKSPDFINVSIFFISAAVAFIYETRLFKSGRLCGKSTRVPLILLCLLALLFILFTFLTPEIAIFKDPITDTYGI